MSSNDDLSEVLDIFKVALEDKTPAQKQVIETRQKKIAELNKTYLLDQYSGEMSCVTAFDEMFGCYSVGGQVRSYYQYGELNACSGAYEKLMFCMTNTFKKQSAEDRKLANQKFYKKEFLIKKAQGSSEDVWTMKK